MFVVLAQTENKQRKGVPAIFVDFPDLVTVSE